MAHGVLLVSDFYRTILYKCIARYCHSNPVCLSVCYVRAL